MRFCGCDKEMPAVFRMHRGDTEVISVRFSKDGNPAQVEVDSLRLSVSRSAYDDAPIFQKTAKKSGGEWTLVIAPEDTKALAFGDYAFDVELKYTANVAGASQVMVKTLVYGILRLEGEVTR